MPLGMPETGQFLSVIPAKAGIQVCGRPPAEIHIAAYAALVWIPAFAGMTVKKAA
jgi:hypothetical protein